MSASAADESPLTTAAYTLTKCLPAETACLTKTARRAGAAGRARLLGPTRWAGDRTGSVATNSRWALESRRPVAPTRATGHASKVPPRPVSAQGVERETGAAPVAKACAAPATVSGSGVLTSAPRGIPLRYSLRHRQSLRPLGVWEGEISALQDGKPVLGRAPQARIPALDRTGGCSHAAGRIVAGKPAPASGATRLRLDQPFGLRGRRPFESRDD